MTNADEIITLCRYLYGTSYYVQLWGLRCLTLLERDWTRELQPTTFHFCGKEAPFHRNDSTGLRVLKLPLGDASR